MALDPRDAQHALQIQAGTDGRKAGHNFELTLASEITNYQGELIPTENDSKIFRGCAAKAIISKTLNYVGWNRADKIEAISLGALATAEEGKKWLKVHGVEVRACKSDILITAYKGNDIRNVGVSVKQCNNKTPTNAQLYFTTATAFVQLLRNNEIEVSDHALNALRQFCGDKGFRPIDDSTMNGRLTDPRRYFWEEIEINGREELEYIFTERQNRVTKLLLQKAYLNDPFVPELLLHRTKAKEQDMDQEYALYTIDELINLSANYSGFNKKQYQIKKGSYKDPEGIKHDAPRFGIIQMQRGGQAQHPTQLQFNLQAGYFYHI
jgi:hypothetical protein